jgi:hypothetical protein
MLAFLAFTLIAFAVYEIVARVRDCRWILPDFTSPNDKKTAG